MTLLIVSGISLIFIKRNWLSKSGAVAMTIMAVWITALISIYALILPIIFLVLGTLASKLNKDVLFNSEKSGRTAIQVLANGGWSMLAAIPYYLTLDEKYLITFTVIFSTALSDTLSSEIGRYYKGKTFDLRTLQLIAPGLSGGISLMGTFFGLIGAVIIALISKFIFSFSLDVVVTTAALGFFGMLLDSIFGAYVQAKYMNHGMLMEEGRSDQLVHGFQWVDNSMVNFLSIGSVSFLSYFLF